MSNLPITLKPCPFCGANGVFIDVSTYNYRIRDNKLFHVGCLIEECYAYWQDSTIYDSQEEAAKEWNTRTI